MSSTASEHSQSTLWLFRHPPCVIRKSESHGPAWASHVQGGGLSATSESVAEGLSAALLRPYSTGLRRPTIEREKICQIVVRGVGLLSGWKRCVHGP